jgi:hypothetical protein
MQVWTEIRRKVLVEKVSVRQICRDYGLSHHTVAKMLENVEPPGYQQGQGERPRPKLGPFLGVIDQIPLVPLAVLKKSLLASFDLRDASGASLPVVPREIDSFFAWSFLCARAGKALNQSAISLPRIIRSHIKKIVSDFPDEDDEQFRTPVNTWDRKEVWPQTVTEIWDKLLASDDFSGFLTDFTFNYILLSQLAPQPAVQIFKFSHQQSPNLSRASFSELLSFSTPEFQIEAPSIGWGRSYHFQVEPPQEMTVTGIYLVRRKMIDEEVITDDVYDVQISNGFAQIHTTNSIKPANYQVKLLMRIAIPGYLRSLWLSTVIAALLLVFGEIYLHRLQTAAQSRAEAAVALLLVAPSLITAYLVRPGEHAIASSLMRILRYIGGISGLLTYAAAAVLVLGYKNESLRHIWICLTGLAIFDACIFTIGINETRRDIKSVGNLIGWTFQDNVIEVPIDPPRKQFFRFYKCRSGTEVQPGEST